MEAPASVTSASISVMSAILASVVRPIFVGVLAVSIGHTFNYKRDYYIPADEVRETEEARTRLLAGTEA